MAPLAETGAHRLRAIRLFKYVYHILARLYTLALPIWLLFFLFLFSMFCICAPTVIIGHFHGPLA